MGSSTPSRSQLDGGYAVLLWFWQFDVVERITYTPPPLEDNRAASQLYTAGSYTYKYKQDTWRNNVCVGEDTFDKNCRAATIIQLVDWQKMKRQLFW